MNTGFVMVDGSMGEGGGQVLRASLALSMALGKPFRMENIRANRPKPGLKRQHLTCLRAAQAICGAVVDGDAINSTAVSFEPGRVKHGEYRFDVGSGGSVTLVLQAIVPALMAAGGPSRITVTGGTHVPFAPPFEFMRDTLFPWLEKLGPRMRAVIARPGFMHVGGGSVTVDITPGNGLSPLAAESPSGTTGIDAVIYCHSLPEDVVKRECAVLLSPQFAALGLTRDSIRIENGDSAGNRAEGAGNAVLLAIRQGDIRTVSGEIGWRGRTAEIVARQAAKRALVFMESGAPIERHLADQLLVPAALAGGGSFVTEKLTPHTRTCLEFLPMFMDIKASVTSEGGKAVRITLQ